MGKRGPKPTPTSLLVARGSWRAKKRAGEPDPGRGRPRCPLWLLPEARAMWGRIAPQLDRMGVLTTADGQALAQYCQTWAKWREAEEFCAANGQTYGDAKGVIRLYPQAKQAMQLSESLGRLGARFGLSPSDRVGLPVTALFQAGRQAPASAPPPAAAPTDPNDKPKPQPDNVIAGKGRFFGGA